MGIDYYFSFGFTFSNNTSGLEPCKKLVKLIFKSVNGKIGEELEKEIENIFYEIPDYDSEDIIYYIIEKYPYELYRDIDTNWNCLDYQGVKISTVGHLQISLVHIWSSRDPRSVDINTEVLNRVSDWVKKLKLENRLPEDTKLGIVSYCSY
jgi:hypothetical protein